MGRGIYVVNPKTDCVELKEFIEVLASRSQKNPLEKILPQLFRGKEIAVHLEDTNVSQNNKESYLLNGRFEANVQSVAEQLGDTYDVRYGIQPKSNRLGFVTEIKHYAVIKRKK